MKKSRSDLEGERVARVMRSRSVVPDYEDIQLTTTNEAEAGVHFLDAANYSNFTSASAANVATSYTASGIKK